jgi:NAD+ kinase
LKSWPEVIVVQKQTALERYTRRALNVDFLDYVERGGGSLENLREAHDSHVECREKIEHFLHQKGLSYALWNLDELSQQGLPFYLPGHADGLKPHCSLVVTLGGDGTLLHASHFVGGSVRLLGVNSCPSHSVGALCAARAENFAEMIESSLDALPQESLRRVRRLWVRTSEHHSLPLALNDVLLCNQHPAATSRYRLSVVSRGQGDDGSVPFHSEGQLSSGLWIAAPAGGSAVIRGYGLERLPMESEKFQVAIREPYLPPTGQQKYDLDRLTLDGNQDSLSLFCRMRAGLVCVDGPDNSVMIGFGTRINISLPEESELRLVLP